MAITVVRQTQDNRVIAAFAEAADATTYATASGSGHDTVTLSDSQQGEESGASLMGKVVSNAGAVSDYNRTGATLRTYRRNRIYDLIEQGLDAVPSTSAEADSDANGIIHKYLRMCYAAAGVDANMNSQSRFNEVENAAKGGDLKSGIREFFRRVITTPATRSAWNTALDNTASVLSSPDENGAVSAKTATLPSGWATNAQYHEASVIGRSA